MKDIYSFDDEFIYGILNIENHNENSSSSHRFLFDAIRKNHKILDGDIFEFGVYKGFSLISLGLLLKKIGSNKTVYGFDTFSGFPPGNAVQDELTNFEKFQDIYFEKELVEKSILSRKIKEDLTGINSSISNISTSLDFGDVQLEAIEKKINYLGLDNIKLVKGEFKDTIKDFFDDYNGEVFAANIDCDLYDGYMSCLPYLCKRLVKGGYIHLDEYYSLKFPGARIACIDFLDSYEENDLRLKKNQTPAEEFERWFITRV